jgi:hypothetical protein
VRQLLGKEGLMLSVIAILALVALLLAIVSVFPQAANYPLISVAVILLAVALFLVGYHR